MRWGSRTRRVGLVYLVDLVCLVHLVSFVQPNKQVSVWQARQKIFGFYCSGKDARDGLLRRRENHASQEACSGGGLGFVHDPFEMLLDGVFAQVNPVRDFFIGKSEHEINDDHLLTFG